MENKYIVNQSDLVALADALRNLNHTTGPLIFPKDYIAAINSNIQLLAPSISYNKRQITITNNVGNPEKDEKFDISINGISKNTTNKRVILLDDLITSAGEYNLAVRANYNSYQPSEYSNTILYKLYSIQSAVEHGTISTLPKNIAADETVTFTIAPDQDYVLPETIDITGCQFTYDNQTGSVSISQVVANIETNIRCVYVMPQLKTPAITINEDNLNITSIDTNSEFINIYSDGVLEHSLMVGNSVTSKDPKMTAALTDSTQTVADTLVLGQPVPVESDMVEYNVALKEVK